MHETVEPTMHLDNLISFVLGTNSTNWTEIEQCYHSLIINNEIPEHLDKVRQCVAQSWLRCKKNGVKSTLPIQKKNLRINNVSEIHQKSDVLLQASRPLFNKYFSFAFNSDKYCVVLHDPKGVVLHSSNPFFINMDLSEEKVGTTAQSLCAALDQPICLMSPENYNKDLQKPTFTVSIPIHDEKKNIVGILALPYYGAIDNSPDKKELITWLFSTLFLFVKTIEEVIPQYKYPTRNLNSHSIDDKRHCKRDNNLNALYQFSDIYGSSKEISDAKKIARKIAGKYGNVLLAGESGTGKELFAHSIHQEYRPEGPFIAINCASIPEGLIESELFGYEGGSFTGANRRGNTGKLEMADGGTLFLDEIGDMPLKLQPSLLRVLEDKRIMRIGGSEYISTDFRVVAATNKDLYGLVRQNKFREDLYYRIAAFEISIPPLKNRGMDKIELARYFLKKHSLKMGRGIPILDHDVTNKILQYEWPGNVRQLQNAMYYALNMCENDKITLHDLPMNIQEGNAVINSSPKLQKLQTLGEVEREAILATMAFTNYNIVDAANILGISRPTLYRRLKEYKLCEED
ncbi:MAG: hypothetical protein H6Q65_812 [Firmicutes bacterium]|nr:hypothetical protein [Bacillota bacterium]